MVNAFARNGERAAWHHVSRFAWHRQRAATLPAALSDLALLEGAIDAAREGMVRDMRAGGATWAEVGEALGVSTQAAHHRYRTVTE